MSHQPDPIDTDDEIITCWCGAKGTYDQLFDDSGLPANGCGGSGVMYCECGGDQCVCHHHGEVQCDGCDDCRPEDHDDYDDDWDEDDE